jgi:hypothetical protein
MRFGKAHAELFGKMKMPAKSTKAKAPVDSEEDEMGADPFGDESEGETLADEEDPYSDAPAGEEGAGDPMDVSLADASLEELQAELQRRQKEEGDEESADMAANVNARP